MEDKIATDFWKKYEKLPPTEQLDIVATTIVKRLDALRKVRDDGVRLHALTAIIKGYIDDIMEYKENEIQKKTPQSGNYAY